VKSLTSFFSVPKGKDYIRMVYDASASGLNDALWAKNFRLPDVDSVLSQVARYTYLANNDVGEMFLNFLLNQKLHPFVGLDFEPYLDELEKGSEPAAWMQWDRCLMGLKSSPYNTIRFLLWAEDVVKGN